MSNAKHDENHVPTLIGLLNTDGRTIVPLAVNPTTHKVGLSNGDTGDDYGPDNAAHDENHVTTMIGVSSDDFETPVNVYIDSSGTLLIKQS